MTYIILFSSDFVQLENKKMVERIQVQNIYINRFDNLDEIMIINQSRFGILLQGTMWRPTFHKPVDMNSHDL